MKTKVLLFATVVILASCTQKEQIVKKTNLQYPETKTVDVVDDYFGTKVKDPYRWLENDTSTETKDWVEAENKVTFDYLSKIPYREKIKNRLSEIWNYPKKSAPSKHKNKYLFFKNNGLQNQSVLWIKNSLEDEGKILLDPNTLSKDGTAALSSYSLSKDNKYLAYAIAVGGSDWKEIFVKNVETGENIVDHIKWMKFSGISWYKNGFYYSGYTPPEKGLELSQKNEFHKLFYHELGTEQSEDKIIMENTTESLRMFYASVIGDEKVLVVYEENAGNNGEKIYLKDLTKTNSEFTLLSNDFKYKYSVIEFINNNVYFKTNKDASKYKLVRVDIENLTEKNWKTIIDEKENVLESCSFVGGQIVAKYMKDAYSAIETYSYDGKKLIDIKLPEIGTVSSFDGEINDNIVTYSFTSFTTPGDIYTYNFKTGESKLIQKSKIVFDGDEYVTEQKFFASKDSTKIPMFIVHKKGIKLDGNNPTLLYGYGGFNISLTPSFSVTNTIWLENGGIYVLVNLRGGGEYGEDWHQAGMKLNKQNVFDDFIGAAEYMIAEKYTNPSKIVIRGGSNGGLLVGAVTNQRPELFKVALPAVGVMDMLRFQKFTIGWNWINDYGSSDDSTQFENLYRISPCHNVSSKLKYPAIMVTTADHDDRVVPAHSFKYIAELQAKYKGENPVLIRIETMAGHSAGKPISKIIDEYTDMWSFVFYNLEVTPKY